MAKSKISEKAREELGIVVATSAIKALDIKIKNKNIEDEEIIPLVLKQVDVKNKEFGVLVVAAASKALKYYGKEKNYKTAVGNVLRETNSFIQLLEE